MMAAPFSILTEAKRSFIQRFFAYLFLERLQSGHPGLPGCLGYSLGHRGSYPLVKGSGDDVLLRELVVGDESG